MATVDRKPLALAWLNRIHNELKPNADFNTFVGSLRLNSYSEVIPSSDFDEWLQSLGEKLNLSPTVGDQIRNAIIVKYSSDKNMLPTRKSIDSAFINLAGTAWGYYDATKVTALEVIKIGKVIAQEGGKLAYAASGTLTSFVGVAKYLAWPALAMALFVAWKYRSEIAGALGGKAVKTLSNPPVYKSKRRRKARRK